MFLKFILFLFVFWNAVPESMVINAVADSLVHGCASGFLFYFLFGAVPYGGNDLPLLSCLEIHIVLVCSLNVSTALCQRGRRSFAEWMYGAYLSLSWTRSES